MFGDLVDNSFGVAPGKWQLWKCGRCRNAYLDPRPDPSAIGKAYADYYTHEEAPLPPPSTSLTQLRHALANGYRNRRFGLQRRPAIRAGYWIALLLPTMRSRIETAFRFVDPPEKPGDSILDIGCGDGSWLEMARELGFDVHGVEPDPISARRARDRGIDVAPDLQTILQDGRKFARITMHHVIEHIHEPVAMLKTCFGALIPRGELYIETPNLASLGFRIYGKSWRGLEVPRHLVLFHPKGLSAVLRDIGFRDLQFHPHLEVSKGMSIASERIERGALPNEPVPIERLRYRWSHRVRAWADPHKGEFITLTCRRPD